MIMDHTDYINKIQEKYKIKALDKTKLITLNDYEENVKKIAYAINKLNMNFIEKINAEIYDSDNTLLWYLLYISEIKIGQYIMTINIPNCCIEYGYVISINGTQMQLKPTLQAQTNKYIKFCDNILLLTRYSKSQLSILKLQKMLSI